MYTTNIAVIFGRLGVKKDKLRTEAVAKLQGELEKEGRAAASSVAMPAKTAVGATTSTKRTSGRKGSYFLYKYMLNFLIQNWYQFSSQDIHEVFFAIVIITPIGLGGSVLCLVLTSTVSSSLLHSK